MNTKLKLKAGKQRGRVNEVCEVTPKAPKAGKGVDSAESPEVIRMVNIMLVEAIQRSATDIHLDKCGAKARLRYRIDGRLHEANPPPEAQYADLLRRLRIMADLDVNERRLPQEGRFAITTQAKEIDVLVCMTPAIDGETVVMRLLDRQALVPNLAALHLPQRQHDDLKWCIQQPHGLIIVGGPTGSGKTTLLYAMLKELIRPEIKVMSIEDPVAYRLNGVTQLAVQAATGLTYAVALRTVLCQDPDVILLGEVRDRETAEIAVKAATTGSLVLSAMSMPDAATGVSRLLSLASDPFLVSTALTAMTAQRLVRKICPACREEYQPDKQLRKLLPGGQAKELYRAKGCDKCNQGYKGRAAITEVLKVDDKMSRLIRANADADTLLKQALQSGMHTMRDSGLELIARGITTLEELVMVAGR